MSFNNALPMPSLTRSGCFVLAVVITSACFLCGSSVAAAQTAPPAPLASADLFQRVMDLLDEKGFKVDKDKAQQAAIEAMLQSVDPHAQVLLTRTELNAMRQVELGRLYAVGLGISTTNGSPVIANIWEGSPAAATELSAGMVITHLNDKPTSDMTLEQVTALLRSAGGEIRGTGGETVKIVTRGAEGATNEVSLKQALCQVPAIDIAEKLPAELCYIRLNGLYKDSAADVVSILKKWQEEGLFGVVLDLRGADGRDIKAAAKLAGLFGEPESLLFSVRDREDQDVAVYKSKENGPLGMPTMVLIDEKTTGAAEALAAALKRSIRGAMLLGTTTSGDIGEREVVRLPNGYPAYLAMTRLVMSDGAVFDGRQGVEPDVKVTQQGVGTEEYEPTPTIIKRETLEEELEDKAMRERVRGDSALRRATDILLGLKALNIGGTKQFQTSSR